MKDLDHLDLSRNPIRTLSKSFILMYNEEKLTIFDLFLTLKGQRFCYFEGPDDYKELLKYYEKTTNELAIQYVSNPESLTDNELERLIHEAGSPEIQILESDLLGNVSILNKIMDRSIERIPDPIIDSLVDSTIPPSAYKNIEKDTIRKDGIKDNKFIWFDDPSDSFQPTIAFFGDPELNHHLKNPDEIVIMDQHIKIEFSYPLKNGTVRDYHIVGGYSRLILSQCIYEGYSSIYEEKDLEKYGVRNHMMGDLSLISLEYIIKKKLCILRIES